MKSKKLRANLPALFMLLLAGIFLVWAVYFWLPVGIDWHLTYRPAALALLRGQSPYSIDIYYAAPWLVVPLIPLALLPERVGWAVFFVLSIAATAYTAHKLNARPAAAAAILLSWPVVHALRNANPDLLVMIGFILPPQVGLLLLLAKPQIGIGAALFWLVESWRRGGWRETLRIFWPVTALLLFSFALFGLWPLRFPDTLELTTAYNTSFWPASLPIGLYLLIRSLRSREPRGAYAAGPFLSPYVLLHTWAAPLLAISNSTLETIVVVLALWAINFAAILL